MTLKSSKNTHHTQYIITHVSIISTDSRLKAPYTKHDATTYARPLKSPDREKITRFEHPPPVLPPDISQWPDEKKNLPKYRKLEQTKNQDKFYLVYWHAVEGMYVTKAIIDFSRDQPVRVKVRIVCTPHIQEVSDPIILINETLAWSFSNAWHVCHVGNRC